MNELGELIICGAGGHGAVVGDAAVAAERAERRSGPEDLAGSVTVSPSIATVRWIGFVIGIASEQKSF